MPDTARARVDQAVGTLSPGYFSLVMASGIVSVGLRLRGHDLLSAVLLWVCVAAFAVLLVLTGWRVVAHRHCLVEDFLDPRRAFGFFTFVAGCNVLGVRLGMSDARGLTEILLWVSGVTWLVLGYVIPWTAVLGPREQRPVLAKANGTWFVWAVASQSVAVAAASLEPGADAWRDQLALLAVIAWAVGVFLYAAVGIFVALRLMIYEFGPEELTPPYWVSMGALAITVLAGARIVEMTDARAADAVRGLVAGLAVVFWAIATWLIPVLVAAGAWRHLHRRIPLTYDSSLWAMIFPLGMYGVAGIYLGQADGLPLVGHLGAVELWVALAAWLVVFVAMLVHLARLLLGIPVDLARGGVAAGH